MACMIGLCFSGFAQSDDAALNKRLAIYLHHTKALDAKELMEYIHPSLFALISKEQFIEVFENTFENKDMVMRIDTITIQRVSKIFAHEKKNTGKSTMGW